MKKRNSAIRLNLRIVRPALMLLCVAMLAITILLPGKSQSVNAAHQAHAGTWDRFDIKGQLFPGSIASFLGASLFAQAGEVSDDGLWQFVDEASIASQGEQLPLPESYKTVALNESSLKGLLSQAPLELSDAAKGSQVIITLPMPDGRFARFSIEESPIMEEPLAAQYPQIKTYQGRGIDDAMAITRFDSTPAGLHALVVSGDSTVVIRPYRLNDAVNYITYSGQDYRSLADDFKCQVMDQHRVDTTDMQNALETNIAVGPTRRTYRIAIAVTREYTNASALGGGTVAGALASINTWLNSVNLIYDRDLSVRLNLVANNTSVIFTAEPDPFTNGDGGAMLEQVRDALRDNIGQANYDLGHVLGTGGGGVAYVGVICNNGTFGDVVPRGPIKGGGVTLVASTGPVGNTFDLGVLSHEMGHQFAADHAFNDTATSNCGPNRSPTSSYEPGSGSTIMAYAGLCSGQNVVNSFDLRFHSGSYAQITAHITNPGAGGACDVETPTGNTAPTVNAGADFNIPRNTPFALTATGSDADPGDAQNLTFCWEQLDVGGSSFGSPPFSDAGDPAGTTRPIFRAFPVSAIPSRTFPSLTYILNNANVPPAIVGGLQTAENLPNVTRTLNFRCTVRDNRGGVENDSTVLNVNAGAGPFLVSQPNTAVSWTGGSSQTVTWTVNNTNLAPISCANVKISLSTDGGNTFPSVLAASTLNDGTQAIIVPNTPTSLARIKVEAVGNIFFDISNANFTITLGAIQNTDTIGLYRPSGSIFYLRNSNTTGSPDLSVPFGAAGDIPVAGDWDGNGTVTVGLYRPSGNIFFLRNSNTPGFPDLSIPFGASGDIPIVGDWDGNGTWTIGLYRPATSTFYLRNSNTTGFPDLSIPFGAPGDLPIAGDWDGNGTMTIGLYRPSGSIFFLRNSNTVGFPDLSVPFGAAGDLPIAGDWDGNGTMTIGLYRPSGSIFFLRNSNTVGFPDLSVPFGASGDRPLAGDWNGQ